MARRPALSTSLWRKDSVSRLLSERHSSRLRPDVEIGRLRLRRPDSRPTKLIARKLPRSPRSWNRCVQRGEVFHLRPPRGRRGGQQRGRRFGVVLQAGDLLALSTVIVAPTSTSALPASFRPEITVEGLKTRVLTEQMGAVDKSRLGESVGPVSWPELAEIDRALHVVLGLAA